MENNNLIDDQSLDIDDYKEVQIKNKKYIKWAIALTVINAILFPIVMFHVGMPMNERIRLSVMGNFIGLPMCSFLLAVVLAFLPYKNLTWQQKYKRVFLLPIIIYQGIMLIGMVLIGLTHLYVYYRFGHFIRT